MNSNCAITTHTPSHAVAVGQRFDPRAFDAILVDVGNVIIYDFPIELAFSYLANEELKRRRPGCELTPLEILEASTNPAKLIARLGDDWHAMNRVAWAQVLDNWSSLCIPIPGAIEALKSLRGFRLTILANQPAATVDVIKSLGIGYLFEEILLDSGLEWSKPDAAFFLYAAQRLCARPESLIMIGDKLDNDILPAQALGMSTVWIKDFPIDTTLDIPFISQEWKNRYFDLKKRAIHQELSREFEGTSRDYRAHSLAALIG